VAFTPDKISVAMTKAFLAVEGDQAAGSARINETVRDLTHRIVQAFERRLPEGGTVHIEDIQDQVELALTRHGEHKVARAYVLYREEHARKRAGDQPLQAHPTLTVSLADGGRQALDVGMMQKQVADACEGLADVDGPGVLEDALRNLYD